MSTQPPDDVLIKRMRAGDDRALAQVYDRHAPMVLSLTRAITGSTSDAEEVAESVFLQLWRNPGQFDPSRGSVRTFLATMARSRARDRIRSLNRRAAAVRRSAAADGSEFAAPVSNPGADPEEELFQRDIRQQVEGLLAHLSDEQRGAIELAYFAGLTQSEIADELDLPLGTVKTRLRDGMARLRQMVAQEDRS